jgi:RNA polymerase sigma-B factor
MIVVTKTRQSPSTRTAREKVLASTVIEADAETAERTIPRGTGPDRAAAAPTIDESVWLLHVCYQRTHGSDLRRLLVEEYEGYARWLARRMHRDGEPLEDLVQVAFEALLLSLDRFDVERGCPFVAFASLTITGALKRHYRDFGWLMRVPRSVHQLAAPSRRVTDELTIELGRVPSLDEVADRMGIDVEQLIEAQEAARARSTRSLSALFTDDDGQARDELGYDDPGFGHGDDFLDLRAALEHLDEDDQTLIREYFFEERTQTELAEQYGVSQMQISRRVRSTTRRLSGWLTVAD